MPDELPNAPRLTAANARRKLRDQLQDGHCRFPASVFDPISVRLAADSGAEIGMFAGSVASLAILGAPDATLITLSEFAEQARRACRMAPVPIFCDADHGYGNALNVMRTVAELEAAGVAGLSIEDTELPEPFAGTGKTRLISLKEGQAKVAAAVAARDDPALVIAGRTSAARLQGIDAAVERLIAYQEAGADLLFAIGIASRRDLDRLAAAVDRPLMLGGLTGELADRAYLASRRVAVALRGHQPIVAAIQAMEDCYRSLAAGVDPKALDGLAPQALQQRVRRQSEFDDLVSRYLTASD